MRITIGILLLVLTTDLCGQSIGPWTQKAQFPGPGRHRGFGFVIGNYAYVGGGWNSAQIWSDFWEYDPSTNSWTQKGTLPGGAALASVGFSIGNKGYFTLGLDASFSDIYTLWEYNPVTNSWTGVDTYPGFAGWGYEGFVIGSKVYIGEEWSNDLYSWDQSTGSWTWLTAPVTFDRDEVALSSGGFGYWAAAMPTGNGLWKYNPTGNIWTQLPNMPAPGITEGSGFAVNGKLYVGSGQYLATGDRLDRFWEYDPSLNSWREVNPIPGLERDDAIGFNIGNKGYLCTGTNGNNLQDLWEFDPLKATGMEEFSPLTNVQIYPNPVTEKALVKLTGIPYADKLRFLVYDLSGNNVYSKDITGDEFEFQRNGLAGGTYIYGVVSDENVLHSGKIVLR